MVKVHYFFDPMCGWCYGASSLIRTLAATPGFKIIYHPGGMIMKQAIDPAFRQHILHADRKIAAMTGAPFGEAYQTRIAGAGEFVVDSYATTCAFLVGQEMGIAADKMLETLQKAHYQEGKHLDEWNVLAELAVSIGLDETLWNENMVKFEPEMMDMIKASHGLMGQMQVSGYPTLITEKEGKLEKLEHTQFYGKISEWSAYLGAYLEAENVASV
ncbi:DsbA family protein [Amphritea atlantica]|uniref:DsbA family protein n=1 Tax=Amphritea atlantica TaxID=355243 RepID=A0ABY5GWJ8_9GAMM|nr:DsbA family protein [Amphritea atlantica]